MSDYPMLISNKLHSFRNFTSQKYNFFVFLQHYYIIYLCPQTIFDNHGKDKIQSPS